MKQGNWKTRKAYRQDVHRKRGGPPNGHYRMGGEGLVLPQTTQPSFAKSFAGDIVQAALALFGRRGNR